MTLRKALLVAACLLALPMQAQASEIECRGIRYGMRVRDVVRPDTNDQKARACEISNKVLLDMKKDTKKKDIDEYCNVDHYCAFRAHFKRRSGNRYIIDRIVGPVND